MKNLKLLVQSIMTRLFWRSDNSNKQVDEPLLEKHCLSLKKYFLLLPITKEILIMKLEVYKW